MEYTDEDVREIFELLESTSVKMCDADWYIDYVLERVWDDIPEKYRRPSIVPEIRRLIMERIDETQEEFKKKAGLIEDDEKEIIEYIININITDEVSGTVYSVQGGGPGYRNIVEDLEKAAGSLFFYEHRDKKPDDEDNKFKIDIKIYRNEEVIGEWDSPNYTWDYVIEILRNAKYAMARIYNEDRVDK